MLQDHHRDHIKEGKEKRHRQKKVSLHQLRDRRHIRPQDLRGPRFIRNSCLKDKIPNWQASKVEECINPCRPRQRVEFAMVSGAIHGGPLEVSIANFKYGGVCDLRCSITLLLTIANHNVGVRYV
eukprot:1158286-Pelagomonas_calceolata.AAC.5